jgi:carboxymethylenebutenolidase
MAAAETSDLQVRIECWMIRFLALIALSSFLITPLMGAAPPPILPLSERVTFLSADGATMLVGYIFRPQGPHAERTPAVVMMHGRAGAYSSAADGDYSAMTLSRRHQQWGHLWARQGYLAILVDGFGPRGYPQGFPRFSYFSRPETLNEVTVRPLDAYGALVWLRKRNDVIPDRIALLGWSNGGSAALATMASVSAPGVALLTPVTGFRGALVFYPACRLKNQFDSGLIPYAPVRIFQGSADEEVSPHYCGELIDRSRARGGDIQITTYSGATHDFDDPGKERRDVPANVAATKDAILHALAFFASVLNTQAVPK